MPVPLVFGAALIQPQEATVMSTAVALALVIGSLAVAYGVELAQEGATSGQFEIRRFGRGAAIVVVLIAALYALSQAGFLFPETDRDQVIPPKKPEKQPPQPARLLFTVDSDRPGPWRLGVLDVYDGEAWLLPPYDTKRFEDVPPNGRVPDGPTDRTQPSETEETFTASFEVNDIEGHVLPNIAAAERIQRDDLPLHWDPRTHMLRLVESRARKGMKYTITAPAPAGAEELGETALVDPNDPNLAEFLNVPPPPSEVFVLLQEAPQDNPFERLQYMRNKFYETVVAAGAGDPVDLPPDRVVEMLAGEPGTPYEITAAEGLLARWAGIPSRIGYGFYAGDIDAGSQTYEVWPKHGSTWLEAYFTGYGWVPIIGTPPRAQSSLSDEEKQEDPEIRPTEELAMLVYVPVRLQSIQLIYVVVRYWLMVTLPWVIGALIVWAFFPGFVKMARRQRRRRWADREGVRERIMTSYAEFRDVASDLNIGYTTPTPLEFREYLEHDLEHDELAWLVSRAIWGDLARDLRPEDAEVAEDMGASLTRRLRRAQPAMTRVIGFASRASLRDPYTHEIPNMWPSWAKTGIRARLRSGARRTFRRARRLAPVGGMLILLLLGSACTLGGSRSPVIDITEPKLPDPIVPDELFGLQFTRETEAEEAYKRVEEEALVADGRVYTVRDGPGEFVQGALQVAAFKPGIGATERELREGVLSGIGTGQFELTRVGNERIFEQRLPEQRIFLWFSPRLEYYEVFIARQGFDEPERVFAGILQFQRGEAVTGFDTETVVDVRRGPPE